MGWGNTSLLFVASVIVACGGDTDGAHIDRNTTDAGSGGAAGSVHASGGAVHTGGSTSLGGSHASGGAPAGGGASNGGAVPTGGVATQGGASGAATGGTGGATEHPDAGVAPDAAAPPDATVTRDAGGVGADGSAPDGCGVEAPPPIANTDPAAGPVFPIPVGLWRPSSFTPPAGTYVFLDSDSGDYIGAGQSYTYTQADSVLSFTNGSAQILSISVTGDEGWYGDFEVMSAAPRLEVGYYPDLTRYPFNPSPEGGLSWYGEGRGCNQLTGWFAVDSVTYTCGALSDIVLRFEQHCEGGTPALHGQIHWSAADRTTPPGPVVPPPASLWHPAPGSTPASGNYVYLTSDSGDYIGQGKTYTYTEPSATLTFAGSGAHVSLRASTSTDDWFGDFDGMTGLAELEPGYYPNLQRWPFNNPARGGLNWDGNGAGCNQLTGWFAVDSINYQSGSLHSLDLRFEQHCEGAVAALRGQVHYVSP